MKQVLIIGGWGYSERMLQPMLDHCPDGFSCGTLKLGALQGAGGGRALADVLQSYAPDTVLAGWSTGGMLVLDYLQKNPAAQHPALLISTTAYFLQDAASPWGVPERNLRGLRQGLRRDARSMLRKFHAQTLHPAEPDDRADDEAFEDDPEVLAAGLDYLQCTDLRNQPGPLNTACAVMHGRCDQVIDLEAGRALAAACGCRCIEQSESGHALPLLHPESVWQTIAQIA